MELANGSQLCLKEKKKKKKGLGKNFESQSLRAKKLFWGRNFEYKTSSMSLRCY